MRSGWISIWLVLAGPAWAQAQPPVEALRVMSFNIRYGTAQDGENRWERRREAVVEVARRAHLVGLQEALAFQVAEMLERMPGYEALGTGREAEGGGETCTILLDRKRLELRRWGTFWLAPEPEQAGARAWDAALPRICTWATVRDRVHDAELAVMNTHLDHRGGEARRQGAVLVAARLEAFAGLPRLVLGDFNAGESSAPLELLRAAGLRDTFRVVRPGEAGAGTFHSFRGEAVGEKIDFVLADDRWLVAAADIVRDRPSGRIPSDHFPVSASVVLDPNAQKRVFPVVVGDPWLVAPNPELGELGGRREEVVDHGIFAGQDGCWQLWACIRGTRIGRLLFGWEGESLERESWRPLGVVMRADSSRGESIDDWDGREWIQAPFVLRREGLFHLFYGGHRAESGECQICLATSRDGRRFTRRQDAEGRSRLFVGPGEARDPMVVADGERFLCYYAGHDRERREPGRIYCRSSRDLLSWGEPIAVQWGGEAGSGRWSAESPFVVRREGWWYLFRTCNYALALTHVYRSGDPLDFGRGDDSCRVGSIRVAAPEIVVDGDKEYISTVHDLGVGIRLARLRWVPEREAPLSLAFLARFRLLWGFEDGTLQGWRTDGEAFARQPVSAEGAGVRGQPVYPAGRWFIGTYEDRPRPEVPAGRVLGDKAVGMMRSPEFVLPDGLVTFLVGGGDDREMTFVALRLVEDDRELFRTAGLRRNLLERVVWDVSAHAGRLATFVVVDQSIAPWGHINCDDFRVEW